MRIGKGMLKGERRINSRYQPRNQRASVVEECGPRERQRWNRGDETCKLTI